MSKKIVVAMFAAGALLTAGDLQAKDQIKKTFTLPVAVTGVVEASACTASPGPQIVINGSLEFAGLRAEVIYTNPSGAPGHEEKTLVTEEVVPAGQPVGIPEQAIVGAVSENPFMWIQFTDERGRPLTSEIFLGRCDGAQFNLAAEFEAPVEALADVSAGSCESVGATTVNLNGDTRVLPINGRLIFRNTDQPGAHQKNIVEGDVALAMLPTGQAYAFPQQDFTGGTTANPLISMQFRRDDGQAIGSEIRLGRCATLAQP